MVEEQKPAGSWEAVMDEELLSDGTQFWRVRWSLPDAQGRFLYVRHYGSASSAWNKNAAEGDAARFNEQHKKPRHFSPDWRETIKCDEVPA